jgi:hypothetical protein
MSTFLELIQQTQIECDIPGTLIADVANQIRELDRLVRWVSQAYVDIQNKHNNWRWMRSRFTVQTATGPIGTGDTYAPTACTDSRLNASITRFARWWIRDQNNRPGITRYLTSGGVGAETILVPMAWATFLNLYRTGAQTLNTSNPVHVTADPQNNLCLGPNPDAVYTINGEYQMSAQVLAANGDIPEMPTRFHNLIVYDAMRKYAFFESAPEVKARADLEEATMMSDLEEDQLPQIVLGGALA